MTPEEKERETARLVDEFRRQPFGAMLHQIDDRTTKLPWWEFHRWLGDRWVPFRHALGETLRGKDEYLREKNELIKAYAGPTGLTPEDVAYALEDRQRLLVLLEEIKAERIER